MKEESGKMRLFSVRVPTYLTVSSTLPSNRMVHEIFDEPPRPNMKTFDGERKIPLEATLDLYIRKE